MPVGASSSFGPEDDFSLDELGWNQLAQSQDSMQIWHPDGARRSRHSHRRDPQKTSESEDYDIMTVKTLQSQYIAIYRNCFRKHLNLK